MIDQINQFRITQGLKALQHSNDLERAAKIHARNMAKLNRVANVLPFVGQEILERRVTGEWSELSEVLAWGYTGEKAVEYWKRADDSRWTLCDSDWTHVGVGSARGDGMFYCVVFGAQ